MRYRVSLLVAIAVIVLNLSVTLSSERSLLDRIWIFEPYYRGLQISSDSVLRLNLLEGKLMAVYTLSWTPYEVAVLDSNSNGKLDLSCSDISCPLVSLETDNATLLIQLPTLDGDMFLYYKRNPADLEYMPLIDTSPYSSVTYTLLSSCDVNGDGILLEGELYRVGVAKQLVLDKLLSATDLEKLGVTELDFRLGTSQLLRTDTLSQPVSYFTIGYAKTITSGYMKVWLVKLLTLELIGHKK